MALILHIVISNDLNGETIVGLNVPVSFREPSSELKTILTEPYILERLINDARDIITLKGELTKKPTPRYEWSGK